MTFGTKPTPYRKQLKFKLKMKAGNQPCHVLVFSTIGTFVCFPCRLLTKSSSLHISSRGLVKPHPFVPCCRSVPQTAQQVKSQAPRFSSGLAAQGSGPLRRTFLSACGDRTQPKPSQWTTMGRGQEAPTSRNTSHREISPKPKTRFLRAAACTTAALLLAEIPNGASSEDSATSVKFKIVHGPFRVSTCF